MSSKDPEHGPAMGPNHPDFKPLYEHTNKDTGEIYVSPFAVAVFGIRREFFGVGRVIGGIHDSPVIEVQDCNDGETYWVMGYESWWRCPIPQEVIDQMGSGELTMDSVADYRAERDEDYSEVAQAIEPEQGEDHDPNWREYREYSDFEEAMYNENMIAIFRGMMEYANEERVKIFVICCTVIERDGDKALYSPQYEGELLAVEEGEEEDYVVLKDVVVMHQEDDPDPKKVRKFTTLEQRETMRIPLSQIADVMGTNRRIGNDYVT